MFLPSSFKLSFRLWLSVAHGEKSSVRCALQELVWEHGEGAQTGELGHPVGAARIGGSKRLERGHRNLHGRGGAAALRVSEAAPRAHSQARRARGCDQVVLAQRALVKLFEVGLDGLHGGARDCRRPANCGWPIQGRRGLAKPGNSGGPDPQGHRERCMRG